MNQKVQLISQSNIHVKFQYAFEMFKNERKIKLMVASWLAGWMNLLEARNKSQLSIFILLSLLVILFYIMMIIIVMVTRISVCSVDMQKWDDGWRDGHV